MMKPHHSLILALVASLGAAAFSGQVFNTGTGTIEDVIEWTWEMGAPGAEVFTSSCVGDFDGDGLRDFVCLRGGEFEIVGSPGLYGWWGGPVGLANDLSLWPAEMAMGDDGVFRDTLITVGVGGLQSWTALGNTDPVTGQLNPTITSLADGAWMGARHVAVAVMATESMPRVVGCTADLRTLRTLRHDGQVYIDEDVVLSPTLLEDVTDLALIDFQDDGEPEITVLTASGLYIYDLQSGALQVSYPLSSGWSYRTMTRGRQQISGPEWVAVVADHPAGIKQFLAVVDINGVSAPLYIAGDPGVVRIGCGDLDRDGDSELLLSLDSVSEVWVLSNVAEPGAGPAFGLGLTEYEVITYSSGSGGVAANQAVPALGDVDADGDLDLLFPVQSTSSLFVRFNGVIAAHDFKPTVLESTAESGSPLIRPLGPDLANPGPLELSITIVPPAQVPPSATHLEIAVFRKDDINATTDPVAVWTQLLTWPLAPEDVEIEIELPDPDFSFNPAVAPGEEVHFENFYVWHQRLVAVSGSRRRVYPATLYGLETSTGTANREYMASFATPDDQVDVFYECLTCSQSGPDEVGTVTPLPCLPTPPDTPVLVPK